jgi:hypothetical protein
VNRAALAAWANDGAPYGAPVLTPDSPAADVLRWLVMADPNGEYDDGSEWGPVTDPWRALADIHDYHHAG